ncbi:MAG: HdeA/HdeB family chaperone [Micropepsaceae bacterium]
MKTILAAAAFALTLAGAASAADAKGNYSVIGLGANTCADYTAAPVEVTQIVGVWMQGYMTALNQALPEVTDVTAGRNDAQLADALYSACRSNPNMLLADATRDIALKMVGTAPKSKAKAEAPAEAAPVLRR